MIRGIVAITLALLIGNPFCCCALGLVDPTPEKAVHACCQGKAADLPATSPDSDDPDRLPCGCAVQDLALAADKAPRPVAPLSQPVPAMLRPEAANPLPRPEWTIPAARDHGPPGGRSGTISFRILYGVFRC